MQDDVQWDQSLIGAALATHQERRDLAPPLLRILDTSLATLGFSATFNTLVGMRLTGRLTPADHLLTPVRAPLVRPLTQRRFPW